ncbi:replication initiator [Catenulispora rubra]|uniref:replication initiator n=1 Tax=Catenulispora rubra TaxID=280293 RepID=UPI001892832D|nr:replication initiator [Catenulispora rubra]
MYYRLRYHVYVGQDVVQAGKTGRVGDGIEPWFDRALLALMMQPEYRAWEEQVRLIGGCEHPIYLRGRTVIRDAGSGVVLSVFDSAALPYGRLMVPCGNRRSSRCGPCSRVYAGDTFQRIRAGLIGGKGVPEEVAGHPMVFATLTAPSFGPVHTRVDRNGVVLPCRARRGGQVCEHGRVVGCGVRHGPDDPALGTPLCPACFDYTSAVLWNAHAGRLWHRFCDDLRRVTLPGASGLTKREFAKLVRVSFTKVAEYQRRGLVHFHAVVRLDGPDGAKSMPPVWATAELLSETIGQSARRVRVAAAHKGAQDLMWGAQFDVQPIVFGDGGEGLSAAQVAGYIAKYATKGAECVGTLDRPITCRKCGGTGLGGACPSCEGTGLGVVIADLPIPSHARALVATAWHLGGLPEYEDLRLRAWAHQCGFGGHFSTASRLYSVTMTRLRNDRAAWQRARAGLAELPDDVIVESEWEFAGSGYSAVEAEQAAAIREAIEFNRELARDAADELARGRDAA